MNARRLLAYYERIADAPDAILCLRRFILDLAVRGKLVPQDPADEPVSGLLKRIAAEKMCLIRADEIKREKPLPPVTPKSEWFELPCGWQWVRLGYLSKLVTSGSRDWAKYYASDGPIFVRMGNLSRGSYDLRLDNIQRVKPPRDTEGARTRLEAGDILVSITGEVGLLGLVPANFGEAYINQHTCIVRLMPELHNRFIPELFRSPFAPDQFNAPQRGIKNSFRLTDVTEFVVPLPPLAEQHRIVAKIGELMALCDRLGSARTEREATRNRLTAASLARLSEPDPETFRDNARFVLNALPVLTTRPDQIKQLCQTILNLAVRGKIVRQDPKDEPASELLTRIRYQARAKHRKAIGNLADDGWSARPYPAPNGWVWASVESLVRPNETATYGILKPIWVKDGVPTVRVTEMKTGEIKASALPLCDSARASKFAKTTLVAGDLLVSKDGTIGKTAFVPPEIAGGNITQHVLRFPITEMVDRHFIRLVIDAPFCQAWMAGFTKGVALQGVNVADFRRMPIPLPPLAEQRRIVAKVYELIALCHRLGACLTIGENSRNRLLDTLLAQALARPEACASGEPELFAADG